MADMEMTGTELPAQPSSIDATQTAQTPATTIQDAPSSTTQPPASVSAPDSMFGYSANTSAILERMGNGGSTPTWEAARNAVLNTVKTSDSMPPPSTPPPVQAASRGSARVARGGRSRARQPSTTTAAPEKPSPAGNGTRGGRPVRRGGKRGGKRRKLKDEDASSDGMGDDYGDDGGEASDDDAYTSLPTKSRSGRKIQRPTHFDPATKTPSKRRGTYRRVPELGICRHCGRGAWTSGNKIVFCDGCQSAWHQFCHWPQIGKEIIEEEGREFFCKECVGGKDGDIDFSRLRSGEGMSLEEKRNYLQTVPPPLLVKLLIHASMIQPSLPIFPPSHSSSDSLQNGKAASEGHFIDQTSSVAALYPPAGSGIPLSSDSADLQWLQESDPEVFSHIYREDIATDAARVGVGA